MGGQSERAGPVPLVGKTKCHLELLPHATHSCAQGWGSPGN